MYYIKENFRKRQVSNPLQIWVVFEDDNISIKI